jgi:hypothetical protein
MLSKDHAKSFEPSQMQVTPTMSMMSLLCHVNGNLLQQTDSLHRSSQITCPLAFQGQGDLQTNKAIRT